jgi:hypothetical protein
LKRFLDDPGEAMHRFRAKQDRRNHLEQVVRESNCDLDLTTDRRGSPHTLVCTKNKASYQQQLKKHHKDLEDLAAIRAIQESLPA